MSERNLFKQKEEKRKEKMCISIMLLGLVLQMGPSLIMKK